MKFRVAAGSVAITAMLVLTGCGGIGEPGNDMAAPTATPTPDDTDRNFTDSDREPVTALTTADSSLGEVVVDDRGMTIYVTDLVMTSDDVRRCIDQCLTHWPPVIAGDEAPELDGVEGELGTVSSPNGDTQLTLNDRPLYYNTGDENPGDTGGQGRDVVWWVIGPNGEPIKD